MKAALLTLALVFLAQGFAASGTGANFEMYLHPTAVVDVGDGAHLALYCAGSGKPTVLMDAGLGDAAYQWALVQGPISRQTRTCSYDRAGYMFSSGLPLPRTSDRIVNELHTLVLRAHLSTPLILVGHSFGSLNTRLFVDRYPSLVAGLVLVDGSHEDQTELFPASLNRLTAAWVQRNVACRKLAARGVPPTDPYCLPDPDPRFSPALDRLAREKYAQPISFDAIIAELGSWSASESEVRAARRSFGHMPLVAVSAGKKGRFGGPGVSPADVARSEAVWARLQDDLASLSKRSDHVTVQNSGHYVIKDAPWVVIAAIERVISEVRYSRDP
jgi:pimeloyl-ACP methyl ester carboxylesterase